MSPWLLLAAWLWPLLLAATYIPGSGSAKGGEPVPAGLGPWRGALLISAPLPALTAALTLPVGTALPLPWLFLGTQLGLDAVARIYLTFTSLLWLAAAVYSAFGFRGDAHARRFAALFLLAMAGNLWLIIGRDLPSFYAGFAMMGLASYGLVIHDASAAALRAGKVYLVMALLGEVTLFAAVILIALQTGTTTPTPEDLAALDGLAVGLALLGLGVKAGMVPLHLWLPLAHPAAPIPASAVLSGTMIKVALLGWMRFLPVGAVALPEWGALLAAMGFLTLFYALPIGLVQADPKTVLAYSSISKMGFMMLLLGLILAEPALAPLGIGAIALYAANHALVKGGLFLGVGLRKHASLQPLVLGALVFLALALAGAPYTSGAVVKYGTKPILDAAAWPWSAAAVAVATVGTTLLMGRFLWVSARIRPHPERGWLWPGLAWTALLALVALFPFVLGKPAGLLTNAVAVPLGILLAGLVAIAALANPPWLRPLIGLIPPGDLVALAPPTGRAVVRVWLRLWQPSHAWLLGIASFATTRYDRLFGQPPGDTERGLRAWPVAGGLWIGITALLTWMLLAAQPLVPGSDAAPAGPSGTGDENRLSTADPDPDPHATAASEMHTAPIGRFVPPDHSGEAGPDQSLPAGAIVAPAPTPEAQPDVVRPSQDVIGPGPAPVQPATRPAVALQEPLPAAADRTVSDGAPPPADSPAEADSRDTGTAPRSADSASTSAAGTAPAQSASAAPTEPAAPEPAPRLESAADAQPPSPCDPPTPYRFNPAGGGQWLALSRCRYVRGGPAEPVGAPALGEPLIRAVQQALTARGYDPGPSDGAMGPRTRAAIRRLRTDKGLAPDDAITFETLDLLQAATQDQSP